MRNKLICYVEGLFEGIPETPEVVQLREEILQNTLDRFDEECAKGASEAVAYNVAVLGIGDPDELLAAYRKPKKEKKVSRRVMVAIAIALYILCVVPPIIADALGAPDGVGASLMFLFVAVATALLIISGGKRREEEKAAEPAAQPQETVKAAEPCGSETQPRVWRVLRAVFTPIYWVAASLYCVHLGIAGYWHVCWIVFVFAAAIGDVVTGIVWLCRGKRGLKKCISGVLLVTAAIVYLNLSFLTHAWWITWLVFPIYAALMGVVDGAFTLIRGEKL